MRITKQDLEVWTDDDELNSLDWYKHYEYHREDGPAEVFNDGEENYFLRNKKYLKDEHWKEVYENY